MEGLFLPVAGAADAAVYCTVALVSWAATFVGCRAIVRRALRPAAKPPAQSKREALKNALDQAEEEVLAQEKADLDAEKKADEERHEANLKALKERDDAALRAFEEETSRLKAAQREKADQEKADALRATLAALAVDAARLKEEVAREERAVKARREALYDTEAPSFGPGPVRVVPITRAGIVAGRPRKEPLVDREIVQRGVRQIDFFVNPRVFAFPPQDCAPQTKLFGKDCNIQGMGGCLPQAWHFYWYGWSIVPDATAHADEVARLIDAGYVEFRFATSTLITVPLSSVIRKLDDSRQPYDVTVSGRPVEIQALEAFRVSLFFPGAEGAPVGGFGLKCVLHGLTLKGICG
ncbi:MAG: hypothetical protein IT371_30450 [Deltaproteobacteria bacterium]|nr:hypothetical protein [Deltaproteobacteria bacterium]